MKFKILFITCFWACSAGFAAAQEQQTDTWTSLREEHKEYIQEQQAENKGWWSDYQQRRDQAIEQCKGGGLTPGQCKDQYLKGLRQEAQTHMEEQRASRREHQQEMQDARRDQIDERKDAHQEKVQERKEKTKEFLQEHPGVNPPGPVGGPGAGPRFDGGNPPGPVGGPGTGTHFKDRVEDVRGHRKDVRDRREDGRDRREDVIDRREDRRDRAPDVAGKIHGAAENHPGKARATGSASRGGRR